MIAVLNINGVIGEILDENKDIITPNATFLDVVASTEHILPGSELHVFIKSPGGYVEEGDDIYEHLIGLKAKGIKIVTFADKICASISTKIFGAGDERILLDSPEFMIHNPFGAPPEGDADAIEAYYKGLRATENALIDFYHTLTGASKETIKILMKKESSLTPEQAVKLRFATSISKSVPINALALKKEFNPNINNKSKTMPKTNQNSTEKLLDSLLTAVKNFGKPKDAKGLKIVLDANAGEIEFPELEADDTPTEGDVTTAEDDSYVMPSGETYVILSNVLDEIIPKEGSEEEEEETEDESEELAKAKVEIEQLKADNAGLKALKTENKALKTKTTAQEDSLKKLASGLKAVKRSISSNFDHKPTVKNIKDENKTRSLLKAED